MARTKKPLAADHPICLLEGCIAPVCRATTTREFRPLCVAHFRLLCKYPTKRRLFEESEEGKEEALAWLLERTKLMDQAYKYELRPDKAGYDFLYSHRRQHFLAYNYAFDVLSAWRAACKESGKWEGKPTAGALYTNFNRDIAPLPEFVWLATCCASARTYAFKDCLSAFDKLESDLRKRKAGALAGKVGAPRRKHMRDVKGFALQPPTGDSVHRWMLECIKPRKVKFPKGGWIRTKERLMDENGRLHMKGAVRRMTFEERAGRWFVSFGVEREQKDVEKRRKVLDGSVVGIDTGVNAIMTLSHPVPAHVHVLACTDETRTKILPPRPLTVALRKHRSRGRKLSGKASPYYLRTIARLLDGPLPLGEFRGHSPPGPFKAVLLLALRRHHVHCDEDRTSYSLTPRGRQILEVARTVVRKDGTQAYLPSRGFIMAKKSLARLALRIQFIRTDHLNKVTTWLARTYDTVVIEGFNVREMVANDVDRRARRRDIMDLGWGYMRQKLAYKMRPCWFGGTLLQLPADEPTDRTCARCGTVNEKLPPHATLFVCENCGERTLTRQENTAMLLERYGRNPESAGGQPAAGGGRSLQETGDEKRPSKPRKGRTPIDDESEGPLAGSPAREPSSNLGLAP